MTAPAIPTNAPAPAPTQAGPFGVDDALASISQAAIQQTLAEQTPSDAPTEQPRGPDGKFVPKAGDAKAGDAPTATETTQPSPDAATSDAPASDDPSPEPVVLPEGYVAVPPVKDRDLATTFKVLDAEGELDVPDLTIEFHANGKTRKEPLDKVVRLAERGVYNEEREQAVAQTKQEAMAIRAQHQQALAYIQQLQLEREQLLASDDAYLTARAQYEQANTPEARIQKLQMERQAEQQAQAVGQAVNLSNQYFESKVLPAVQQITSALPTVTADEIGARLILLTNHLRVPLPGGDTFIPPANHQAVDQIILREIVPWAQQLHDDRDTSTRQQRDAAEREKQEAARKAREAQADAQKAKSLVGRQTRPTGRAPTGSATREAPAVKPIKTVEDAEQAALRDTLAAVL